MMPLQDAMLQSIASGCVVVFARAQLIPHTAPHNTPMRAQKDF